MFVRGRRKIPNLSSIWEGKTHGPAKNSSARRASSTNPHPPSVVLLSFDGLARLFAGHRPAREKDAGGKSPQSFTYLHLQESTSRRMPTAMFLLGAVRERRGVQPSTRTLGLFLAKGLRVAAATVYRLQPQLDYRIASKNALKCCSFDSTFLYHGKRSSAEESKGNGAFRGHRWR